MVAQYCTSIQYWATIPVKQLDTGIISVAASPPKLIIKGRGALSNAGSRYDPLQVEAVDDGWSQDESVEKRVTETFPDAARSIISYNDSPDIGFDRSINPYRGCEHACIYCYARPTHAYLGLSPGLDFETRIFVKHDAAELLRKELASPRYQPAVMALGANTDPYQPVERRLGITRQILQVLHDCSHPVAITTKSALVERDIDLLAPMAREGLAQVAISVTSLDHELSRRLEPRAASPQRRLKTIRALSDAGIPVTALVSPIIPSLNDREMEDILAAVKAAGACSAYYILLRLPLEVETLFEEWLAAHYPLKATHVMSLVRQMRGGRAYQSGFGTRMTGTGIFAELLAQRFQLASKQLGLNERHYRLDCSKFVRPSLDGQLTLF